MLSVRCPTCQTSLGLADEMLGQTVRCGNCQEVFVAEPPPEPRPSRRREDEDDEPRSRRRSRREDDDDDDDRPSSRRRSRRDDDGYDDDEDYDRPRRRSRRRRRPKKRAPGKPGLATAAGILWLIWGCIGGLLSIWSIIGLINALDWGAPAAFVISATFQTICLGAVSYYLAFAGLEVLNGQAENLSTKALALLIVTVVLLLITVFRAAYYTAEGRAGPGLQFAVIATACGVLLILSSGIILGCIFAMVANRDYERWVRS